MAVHGRHGDARRAVERHREAARHDAVIPIDGDNVKPHGERTRVVKPVSRPGRRRGAIVALFGDVILPVHFDVELEGLQISRREGVRHDAEFRAARPARAFVSMPDDEALRVRKDVNAGLHIAEPPAVRLMQNQVLAEKRARRLREMRRETPVLHHGRAEEIHEKALVLAERLNEADRAGEAARIEFQRVAVRALNAPDHEIDRLQPFQRLHVDAAADHTQIPALDKLEAEIAREIGVAEIVLVARPRRQERDQGIVALDALEKLGLELLEVGSEFNPRYERNKSPISWP